jgi:hypothetical protein
MNKKLDTVMVPVRMTPWWVDVVAIIGCIALGGLIAVGLLYGAGLLALRAIL